MTEATILFIGSGLALSAVALLAYFLLKIKQVARAHVEAAQIISEIMSELGGRQDKQDVRIAEHQVKLEIIESRLNRDLGSVEAGMPSPRTLYAEMRNLLEEIRGKVGAAPVMPLVASQRPEERAALVPMKVSLNSTEKEVLSMLVDGPLTPGQIRARVERSREHVARLLKRLFERQLVERNELKKPFVYRLTERGRSVLLGPSE